MTYGSGVLRGVVPTVASLTLRYRAALLVTRARVEGGRVGCCGPIPIPFRF